jgi:Inner membrane component of T3SS, cytoplasmic domain
MTQPATGQEFLLSRPSQVIGRTKDNDVILDYKSISRHHAEIIRDGERYVLIDRESVNGVRINGLQRDLAELRPGDMIQLGHVRLRFARASDPAIVKRGAPRPHGARKKVVFGLVAGLVVMGSVLVKRKGEIADRAAVSPSGQMAGAPPTPAAESGNAARVAALQRLLDLKDYSGVLKGVATIGEDSVYRDRARVLAWSARGGLVGQHLSAAEKRRKEGNCLDARKEAAAALALESHNQTAQDLIAHCGQNAGNKTRMPAPRPTPVVRSALATPRPDHAGRRHAAGTAAAAPARVTPPPEIVVRPPGEKPHRRPIETSDPYSADQ